MHGSNLIHPSVQPNPSSVGPINLSSPYFSSKPYPADTPPDLRTTSLNLKLSRSSAGLPGDDVGDIEAIRDTWVEEKARKKAGCGFENLM
jgi:hypothetical protein